MQKEFTYWWVKKRDMEINKLRKKPFLDLLVLISFTFEYIVVKEDHGLKEYTQTQTVTGWKIYFQKCVILLYFIRFK